MDSLNNSTEAKAEEKPKKVSPQRIDPAALVPGMWVECSIVGRKKQVLYVLQNFRLQEHVWLASIQDPATHISLSYKQLRSRMIFLGKTSKRWWWSAVPWRRSICPFKPLPRV